MSITEFRCHRDLPNGQRCQVALGVKTPLGLQPLVPVELIDPARGAWLRCPACGNRVLFKQRGQRGIDEDSAHGKMLLTV